MEYIDPDVGAIGINFPNSCKLSNVKGARMEADMIMRPKILPHSLCRVLQGHLHHRLLNLGSHSAFKQVSTQIRPATSYYTAARFNAQSALSPISVT